MERDSDFKFNETLKEDRDGGRIQRENGTYDERKRPRNDDRVVPCFPSTIL